MRAVVSRGRIWGLPDIEIADGTGSSNEQPRGELWAQQALSAVAVNALRFRRLGLRLAKKLRSRFGNSSKTYFHDRVVQYREIWTHAAKACGAQFAEVAPDLWRVERDGVGVFLLNHRIQLDDPVTLMMAGRKPLMHRLLREAGLNVPPYRVFTLQDMQAAMQFLTQHPKGVVVKPANGSAAGDGVSTCLTRGGEVRRAALVASLYDAEILIEAQVPGESYRAIVVGGRMLNVVCRQGPRVMGDGRRSVRTLIEQQNQIRKVEAVRLIEIDRDCLFTLDWQGLTPAQVVPEGTEVLLKAVESSEGQDQEVRTVYNADVTDLVCPSIQADVEEAARILGSDFVGVDLIMTDPTRPLSETGGCLNEVNTTPALHHHYDSKKEEYPTVAVDVLELALRRRAVRRRSDTSGGC